MSVSVTDLYPYIRKVIMDSQRDYNFMVDRLFETIGSSISTEKFLDSSSVGLMQEKAKGAEIQYDDIYLGNETSLRPVTYALGIKIAEEDLEDENYNIYSSAAKNLAMSDLQTVETIGFNIFNNAFDSNYVGGDGVELCSTAHPLLSGGTWSNELSTPARLSMTSFEAMRTLVARMPNHAGLKTNYKMKELVIPTELYKTATEIVNSAQDPETSNNAINAFKGKVSIVESPYLTNTVRWFVTTTAQGLKKIDRKGFKFSIDNEFNTGDARYKGRRRVVFGWTDAHSTAGSAAV